MTKLFLPNSLLGGFLARAVRARRRPLRGDALPARLPRDMTKRFELRGFVPKWMNVLRAVSTEGFGRLKYYGSKRRATTVWPFCRSLRALASWSASKVASNPLNQIILQPTSDSLSRACKGVRAAKAGA